MRSLILVSQGTMRSLSSCKSVHYVAPVFDNIWKPRLKCKFCFVLIVV